MNIKEYDALSCADTQPNCPDFYDFCNTGATIDTRPVEEVCPLTCQVCASMKNLKCLLIHRDYSQYFL